MLKNIVSRTVGTFSTDSLSHPAAEVTRDKYNAIHVTLKIPDANNSVVEFVSGLLQRSSHDGTSSLWVHLKEPNLHLVGELCKAGLSIHTGKDREISLNKWLIKEKANKVVPYSMYHISCGGLFIEDGKVLLAQQKAGDLKGRYAIPGGRADHGQTIKQCSERQVWEEIGMEAEFQGVMWMRELKGYLYGSNDIYYVCLMKAKGAWDKLKLCDDQIASVKWVPLSENEQFSKVHSMGTQRELSQFICSLHVKGFDFANFKQTFDYGTQRSLLDGKERHIGRHEFAN